MSRKERAMKANETLRVKRVKKAGAEAIEFAERAKIDEERMKSSL